MTRSSRELPILLSVQEAADRLGVSTKQVRRLITAGDLPHHRIGRLIRITDIDLMAFIRLRRVT